MKTLEWQTLNKCISKGPVLVSQAARTAYHRLEGLNNKNTFPAVLDPRSLRSECWQVRILLRPLSLACRRLSSRCVFMWSFLYVYTTLVSPPLLIKTSVILDQGSTLIILFNLNYPFKGPISKNGSIGGQEFGRDTIQSLTGCDIRKSSVQTGYSAQTRIIRDTKNMENTTEKFRQSKTLFSQPNLGKSFCQFPEDEVRNNL